MRQTSALSGYRLPALLLCLATVVVSLPHNTGSAMIPFGGPVATMFPACMAPPALGIMLGPPTAIPIMYIPGQSFSYAYGPPAHPGQNLLGSAGPFVPCMIPNPGCLIAGLCPPIPNPAFPGGTTVLFHGASV